MKRLYRSQKDRMIGGVCGGIGEHIDVDPTVIRLLWAFATLISVGGGLLIYLIAWFIIPEEDGTPSSSETTVQKDR